MKFTIPQIQVRSNSFVLFDLIDSTANFSSSLQLKRIQNMTLQQKKQYSGSLTAGTKKRLAKAIDLMVQSIKPQRIYSPVAMREITHRLSFITLTVSSQKNITAKEAYRKAFKHFIQWLRRTQKVTTYVWKAETQKRGQIHYHITTPSYIHYQEIKDKWNNLQRHAGWLEDYHKAKGHYNPNSTDIHEVRKVKDLSSYMIKEFCKTIQNAQTVGKVWDCSLNLKKHKYYRYHEFREDTILISEFIDKKKVDVITLENCIVVKFKKCHPTEAMNLHQIKRYDDFLTAIRNYRK